MDSAMTSHREHRRPVGGAIVAAVCWIGAAILLWLALSGCASTVAPQRVQAAPGAHSGDNPHSGLTNTAQGLEIDARARDRYNALIDLYGKGKDPAGIPNFIPALSRDFGLTPTADGGWLISHEAFVDFSLMAGWARSGVAP